MDKNKKTIIGMIVFLTVSIIIAYFLGAFNFNDGSGNVSNPDGTKSDYSWDTDPNRLALNSDAFNLTLIINYDNGTIDSWTNLNLSNHYTSCFDLVANKCVLVYDTYEIGGTGGLFYITSINGLAQSTTNSMYWLYYINDQYAPVASNGYQLHDNDTVLWVYSPPVSQN